MIYICTLLGLFVICTESSNGNNFGHKDVGIHYDVWDRKDLGKDGVENWDEYKVKPKDKDGGHPYRLKGDGIGLAIVGIEKDDTEDLERPCKLDDWGCVRKVFAANSDCKPAAGHVPDPLYLRENTVYFMNPNISVTLNKLKVNGLSDVKIRDFYINKDTGNLVFAIDVRNLTQTTPAANFRYKRTGKESIVLTDFATVSYESVTFTAVIPKIPKLRLEKGEMHVDAQDGQPEFAIGPQAANTTDPDVITGFAEYVSNIPLAVREAFIFQSYLFTSVFIQSYVCDFGIKNYSY